MELSLPRESGLKLVQDLPYMRMCIIVYRFLCLFIERPRSTLIVSFHNSISMHASVTSSEPADWSISQLLDLKKKIDTLFF